MAAGNQTLIRRYDATYDKAQLVRCVERNQGVRYMKKVAVSKPILNDRPLDGREKIRQL